MRSSAAQILETALALQRAPGERFRLRQRPLPPDIIRLMEVAAGSPQALQLAAVELGEPEAAVLEAARFYLEQVLFADPDANAYRVLGVAPDVSPETIRMHHRWLQRWLHPDRAQAGDASVFATRVNQAFSQLRSPEARHAYDVHLAEIRLANAASPLDPDTVRRWEGEEEAPSHGRRSRWLLAAALVSCVVLAVLIVRNPEKSAAWDGDVGNPAAAARAGREPAMEDRDLGVLSAALRVAPTAGATETANAPSREPVPVPVPVPAPAALVAEDAPQVADPSVPARPIPVPVPVPGGALHPPARHADQGARAVVASVSTVPAATALAAPSQRVQVPIPLPPQQRAVASLAITEEGEAAMSSAAVPAQAASPPPRSTAPAEDSAQMLDRMRQAERRVAQVAAYLAARPGAAPMWNDPQTEAEAARARAQLNARKGSKLELSRPAWRLQSDSASLRADYRCHSAANESCEGRLDVKLVWREGLWLVRGVGLGPSA